MSTSTRRGYPTMRAMVGTWLRWKRGRTRRATTRSTATTPSPTAVRPTTRGGGRWKTKTQIASRARPAAVHRVGRRPARPTEGDGTSGGSVGGAVVVAVALMSLLRHRHRGQHGLEG